MFYDLDVNVPRGARSEVLDTLSRLGYNVIAFTTIVSGVKKLKEEHVQNIEASQHGSRKRVSLFQSPTGYGNASITVLERVTLVIDETSQLPLLSSPLLSKFDLVAVRPGSEKLMQQCLQFDFDILSLSLERRQLFHVKRPQVHVAVEKGVMFEIGYAVGLRDRNARKQLIGNACSLSRVSGGKNLLLSSGAKNIMELRGSHDVINLGVLFDIPLDRARDAVSRNAEACVVHGDIRARVHKGIARVIPAGVTSTDQAATSDMKESMEI